MVVAAAVAGEDIAASRKEEEVSFQSISKEASAGEGISL